MCGRDHYEDFFNFIISHTKYKFESFVTKKLSPDNYRLNQLCDGLSLTDHQHRHGEFNKFNQQTVMCTARDEHFTN